MNEISREEYSLHLNRFVWRENLFNKILEVSGYSLERQDFKENKAFIKQSYEEIKDIIDCHKIYPEINFNDIKTMSFIFFDRIKKNKKIRDEVANKKAKSGLLFFQAIFWGLDLTKSRRRIKNMISKEYIVFNFRITEQEIDLPIEIEIQELEPLSGQSELLSSVKEIEAKLEKLKCQATENETRRKKDHIETNDHIDKTARKSRNMSLGIAFFGLLGKFFK